MTTPYWVWIETFTLADAHFGLWNFCIEGTCRMIHDNLVEGRDIPSKYSKTPNKRNGF